jgi:hypothetical protein
MSTDGDRNISGTPDVAEHNNSSPHSGRSRGGRFQTSSRHNRTETLNNSSNSSSRGRGKTSGRSGGRRGVNPKDEHQVSTILDIFSIS